MKRLLLLTAVALFTASAVGCECCRWCRRGALLPAAPAVDPCLEPATTYSPGGDPCTTPPAISPGAETFVPGPTG